MARKWTGLKDKNGRKIYIGSLVYEPSWWWGSGIVIDHISHGGQQRRYIVRTKTGETHNTWDFKEIMVVRNPIKEKKFSFPSFQIALDQ